MIFRPPFLFPATPLRGSIFSPLRGLVLGGAVQSSAGALSLAFATSGVVTTGATIAVPAAAAVGDLAIFFDSARNGASVIPTKVIPNGWTEVADVSGSGVTVTRARSNISYKVLAAGEPGANITGMDDTAELKIVAVFRPSRPISSITPATATGEVSASAAAQQAIAAAGAAANRVVLALAQWFSANAQGARTSAPAMTEITNGTVHFAQYTIYNSAPASHTIDMGDSGTLNVLQGVYLEIA